MWLELGSLLPFVLVSNNPFSWAVWMIDVVLPAWDSNWCSSLGDAPPFPSGTVEWSQSLHTETFYFHQERWEMLLELGKDSEPGFGVV